MTIIVYRDGVMAADSFVTDRGCIVGQVEKIRRCDGLLVASAGGLGEQQAFFAWVEAGFPPDAKPKIENEDFEGLVVRGVAEVMWYGKELLPTAIKCPYTAIGCGFRVAMGALAMGAGAERAVEIVCSIDFSCGGEIMALEIDRSPRF